MSEEEFEEKLFGRFGYLELAKGGTLLLKEIELLARPRWGAWLIYLGHPLAASA
jgi:transcriptional regulator with AAA-type ATPase domain